MRKTISAMLSYLSPHRKPFAIGQIAMLVGTAAGLAFPWAVREVFDTLFQVNDRALFNPARPRRRRSSSSSTTFRMAPAIPSTSSGSTFKAASPTTSGSEDTLEHITGQPQAMASRGGRPNPSYSEG